MLGTACGTGGLAVADSSQVASPAKATAAAQTAAVTRLGHLWNNADT